MCQGVQEGIRRLYLQAPAIIAVSWCWPTLFPTSSRAEIVEEEPIVLNWLKKPRSRVVLRALSRNKNDLPFLGY